MATFPTADDISREAPRVGATPAPVSGGMPKQSGSIIGPTGRSLPVAGISGAATPAAPSDAGANALYRTGTQMKEFAAEIDRFGGILDETRAQDALNQLRAKRQELTYDPEKGFTRLKGGDVVKKNAEGRTVLDEMPASFKTASEEIGKHLLSPRARAMYQQKAFEEQVGYKKDLTTYVVDETRRYEVAVDKDTMGQAITQAAQFAEDPAKVMEAADRAAAVADRSAKRNGLPSQAVAARSNVFRVAIETQVANGNTSEALTMFGAFKGKLDGADLVAVSQTMKTVGIGETAKAQAGTFTATMPAPGQAEEDTKASLAFWKTEYSEKVAAGITAGFLGESQFFPGARNKKDGRDGSDSINIGQWNAGRAKAFLQFAKDKGLDPNDMNTGLQYAKAEIDGEIPRSISGVTADFKDKLKNAKTEQEAADLMVRGYFKPKWQDGESAIRGKTASGILAKYGEQDPLRKGVDAATGATAAPKNGPLYQDTRQMLLDADLAHDVATRRNAEFNAGNDDQRRATQSQLDLKLAATKRQIEIAKLQLEIGVDKWMTTGGPPAPDGAPTPATSRPPPEIWNQLPYTKQQSIDATIAHNVKGATVATNDQVWGEIHRSITSADPAVRAEWALKPLWEFKPYLSSSDFQELSRMQGVARMGDPNKELTHVQTANGMIDDTLQTLGVDTKPSAGKSDAEKANNFRRLAQQQITAFEVEQKRKSTAEEQRKIIDRLAMPTFLSKGTFYGENTKPAYEVKITDIPAAEREKIVEALKSVGRTVTDDAIVDLYRRNPANARPKK
jgi:hypothetical protein